MRATMWLAVAMLLLGGGAAHAAGFDPEATTRAYLATVNGAARARSDAYFEGGYWLILWGALVTLAVNALLLWSGIAARLSMWAGRRRHSLAGRTFLFGVAYVLLTALVTLPYSPWTDFYREAAYGLNNQTLGHWFGDWAIATALGTIVAAGLFVPIMLLVRRSPTGWWGWGVMIVMLFAFIGGAIAPVVIEPLFNRYTPLTQEPLRSELISLGRANGVPVDKILVVDASRQTKKISANVAGFGGTTRVAMNDNLLATHDDDMIRAILGHEMGHYLLGHTFRLLCGLALIVLAGFWLVSRIVPALLARFGARWRVVSVDDPGVIPVAAMVLAVLGLLATPLQNALVRTTEAQADIFGLNASRAPDGFARAALTLSQYRKLEPTPLEEAVFYDHPSGRSRIAMAMRWKAEHLGQADVR